MMLFGDHPCDGRVEQGRCTACALQGLGAPRSMAAAAASGFGVAVSQLAATVARPMRAPGLIAARCDRFASFIGKADRVVAVCDWVRAVLERNGVPSGKIVFSRQGLARSTAGLAAPRRQAGPGLKVAYFGRSDRTKGPDLLALALQTIPDVDVAMDIYAVRQPEDPAHDRLVAYAERDSRLRILPPVAPERVVETMTGYDMVAVPSRWLETGPLVVLESFAAGTPVLGSNLGGIAELVRDGVDGVLVEPDDTATWGAAIARLAREPALVASLSSGVRPPRTMDAVASDMAEVYASLLASHSTAGAA
jgi:glycosyltransferase involved in cell wall biosynthesis